MHVSSSYSIGSGTSPVDASQASQRRNANADDAIAKPDPSEEPIARPKKPIDGFYTIADHIVLKELYHDINNHGSQDVANCSSFTVPQSSLNLLESLNDPTSEYFQPDVLSSWDFDLKRTKGVRGFDFALRAYVSWARTVVRHETDVIFLSHLLIYTCTLVPSAIYLYSSFSWIHGVLHTVFAVWCAGAFTLLLHNHIHNRGVLSKEYAWLDFVFPYVLEPLMGHTWDSYFYHHVKHHHVEGNGPDDLSSTIRYQRDSLVDFAKYEARFLALLWLELPLYFWTRKKYGLAVRAFGSEMASLGFMVHMAWWHLRATVFVLIIPFCVLRLGLMIGNWGQHALVDEVDPESDFRSSITLIDVPSNRFCFNDGYHTSHHLNPRRHWRAHPSAFIKAKDRYASEGALVFHGIDYLGITFCLLTKKYGYLADRLVPMGKQVGMSREEVVQMLRMKTRRFSEEEIRAKFGRGQK